VSWRNGLWLLLLLLPAGPAAAVPLWSATHPDAAGSLLLLGSVHALRAEDQPLPAAVLAAYRQADRLVMELHPDELRPEASLAALTRVGILSPGHSARDVLDDQEWEAGERLAAAAGVELAAVAALEPWFAAITVYAGALAAAGYQPELGVDAQVAAWAARDAKPVVGLESLDEQLLLFKGLEAELQRTMLIRTLDEVADVASDTRALVKRWRERDIDALEEYLEEDFRDFEALRELIVTRRNLAWHDEIQAMFAVPGTTLVVVGALHLVGPEGLPALLEAAGFSVVPTAD
jgi:uncharacterized protein